MVGVRTLDATVSSVLELLEFGRTRGVGEIKLIFRLENTGVV